MKIPNFELDRRQGIIAGTAVFLVAGTLGALGAKVYSDSTAPTSVADADTPGLTVTDRDDETGSISAVPRDNIAPVDKATAEDLFLPDRHTSPVRLQTTLPPGRLKWPIKPFNRPHVIRSTFGEPRGLFSPPSKSDIENGRGILDQLEWDEDGNTRLATDSSRRLHVGVDITGRAGTPVYSLLDGVAKDVGPKTERVTVGEVEYTHLIDRVPNGTKIRAFKTVIGRISPEAEHVHLNLVAGDGRRVNPLSTHGFVGYNDTVSPVIKNIKIYNSKGEGYRAGRGETVEIFANAFDRVSVGGTNDGKYRRVGVYAVNFSLVDLTEDRVVTRGPVWKFDRMPSNDQLKYVYFPTSTRHRPKIATGKPDYTLFEYRLNPEAPIELTASHEYRAVVSASDAFGNSAKEIFEFEG